MRLIRHWKCAQGYSLLELLLVVALSSILLLVIGRLLPQLSYQQRQLFSQQRLKQELYSLLMQLEKDIRRAGYCNGENCGNSGLVITNRGRCLLVRWDENHNGRWEPPGHLLSEYFGYRLHAAKLEAQRGSVDCLTGRWESLIDSSILRVEEFHVSVHERLVRIRLTLSHGQLTERREWYVWRENSE